MGQLSLSENISVGLLTRKPNLWNRIVTANVPDGSVVYGRLKALNVKISNIETLLAHYESTTPQGMTKKIRSIESITTILSPMKEVRGGWIPDIESRYFVEDFPLGLSFICKAAKEHNVNVPNLDKVLNRG